MFAPLVFSTNLCAWHHQTQNAVLLPLQGSLFLWRSRVSWFGVSCHFVCGTCLWIAHGVSSRKSIFFDSLGSKGTLSFYHPADINDLFDGMCATEPRILADVSALSLMWMTFCDVHLGGPDEADDAAVEGSVELEALRRSRRCVASNVCKHCSCCQGSCPWVDKRKANCTSSSVSFEVSLCQPSIWDGCLELPKHTS